MDPSLMHTFRSLSTCFRIGQIAINSEEERENKLKEPLELLSYGHNIDTKIPAILCVLHE